MLGGGGGHWIASPSRDSGLLKNGDGTVKLIALGNHNCGNYVQRYAMISKKNVIIRFLEYNSYRMRDKAASTAIQISSLC